MTIEEDYVKSEELSRKIIPILGDDHGAAVLALIRIMATVLTDPTEEWRSVDDRREYLERVILCLRDTFETNLGNWKDDRH